jgi:hypothetical protein
LSGLYKHKNRIVVVPFVWLIGSLAARRRERLNPTLELVEQHWPRSTASAVYFEKIVAMLATEFPRPRKLGAIENWICLAVRKPPVVPTEVATAVPRVCVIFPKLALLSS